ncbi:Cas1p-like protein [Phlyctema vagabunda]|uniref:Cas1p-like protein n=1 Tax=Phlyctema vagabunda TaxID=108571 RepID=A0ABR4PNV0_9HELO
MPRAVRTMAPASARHTAVRRTLQSLLFIVVVGVIYRYCWIDASDPFKCGALLNKGEWLDPALASGSERPFQNWQPPGCMMHEYRKDDIKKCFQKRRLVFVGDSTTRQIYWATAQKMDFQKAQHEMESLLDSDEKHVDLKFESDGVTVEFIWDPWMNSTGLDHELKHFRPYATAAEVAKGEDESAGLILLGAPGLWYARHGQENYFRDFKETVDRVIPYMDHNRADSPTERQFPAGDVSPNFLLLAPIQVPWYPSLSPSREATMTPEKIDLMNDYLQQVSAHSNADIVWSYSLMTWSGRGEYEESGLHVVENVAHRKADVLLNLRCNADAASKGYPFNRSCCTNYSRPGFHQWLIILAGMLVIPILSFLRRKHISRVGRFLPSAEVMTATSVFTLAVCYCFYADRTQVFEKAQKQFKKEEFLTVCLVVAIAAVPSIRRTKPSGPANRKGPSRVRDQGFLSRDQADEWKGWMQSIILIYHYYRGSKALWIYEIIRLFVASYLFMTGYGHTLYFLRKEDYSLNRVATVLVRLNLLSCVLPFMVRSDYLFYYFAPLVSFWFLVVYFTLRVGKDGNMNIWFLFGKVIIAALVTTAIILIPGVLEVLSVLLKYSCGISWDMEQWRFRCFLDMFIVYVGMIFAILYQRMTWLTARSMESSTVIDKALRTIIRFPRLFGIFSVIISSILLPGFWLLTRRSPNKEDYNWWMPYISFIPVISFVVLRNAHSVLRNYHFEAFAWLGRISLETYILQYHIWLAGDSSGLLRLGIWNRWIEAAILSCIFIWISWCTADATHKLTGWIVNGNETPRASISSPGWDEDDIEMKRNTLWLPSISPTLEPSPSKSHRVDLGNGKTGRLLARVVMHLGSHLKWRVITIVLALWICNITYR